MKHYQKCKAIVVTATILPAVTSYAQSSVTVYGLVDDVIVYQNSQAPIGSTSGGHSNVKLVSGVSRFGIKGEEDLGSGTKSVFQLESGFNTNTGSQQFTNAMFGRQAWVGIENSSFGMVTMGRQYTSYFTLLQPYSPMVWMTGFFGAHPGDLDSLDTVYRANNSIVYRSPSLSGFSFSGSYSLGGVPGSINRGFTWSGAVQYATASFGIAAGIQRIGNSTPGGGIWGTDSTTNSNGQPGVSAVTNGYQTAQAQQRIAVTGDYALTNALDLSASYSNVQYIPGVNSKFSNTATFNTGGTVLHWKATPAWDLAASYSYTRATKANGITNAAQYHEFNLAQYYSLSKRTTLFAVQAFERAQGKTLGTEGGSRIIDATAVVGDGFQGAPSSSRNQIALGAGIFVRF
ncbi:porin [Paraburkholderia sp. D1E]|uniref:porin n=1 Tax=Paraburkholderia sp. D1E TaxID=3461398 RepID=UPI004045C21F